LEKKSIVMAAAGVVAGVVLSKLLRI